MVQVLLRCLLVVFCCYDAVTSREAKAFSPPRSVAPLQTAATTSSGVVFPSVDDDEKAAYSRSTPSKVEGNRVQSSTSPPILTTVSNEVIPEPTYELASEAVHSVATRLHHLLDPSGRKNYLVSPLSVALLTGQILLASRGDSERRLRNLLTGLRAPWAPASNSSTPATVTSDTQREADLELHVQLGRLLKHLQSQPSQSENATYQLSAASAFFLSNDLQLNSSFQKAVRSLYGSDLVRLNFSGDPTSAMTTLNKWAYRNTAGRIPTIYESPLPRQTAVVLVNSVYFRAEWLTPFEPELTTPGVFRLNGTHQIAVQYMRGVFEDTNFVDHPELACRMVILPYKSPDVNMYVILPNKDVGEVKDFAMKLSTWNITSLIKASSPNTVTVVLPKMTLTGTYSLKDPIMRYKPQSLQQSKEVLEREPLPEVFSRFNGRRNRTSTTTAAPAKATDRTTTSKTTQRTTTATTARPKPTQNVQFRPKPTGNRPNRPKPNTNNEQNNNKTKPWFDLSGASSDSRFRINDIVHQISLEVSETGTEAAAITSGSIDYSGNVKVIKVDRPFMFFIRHEPSLVNLFYGVIMDPTNGNYE